MSVRVQQEDFDVGREIAQLRASTRGVGAVASFVGVVRDLNDAAQIRTLTLEHYPGMTEKALERIVVEARQRWDVYDILVIHRVGVLKPSDQIVLVVVTSAHRGDRKSTRLNSSHRTISYAVFCLKKKTKKQ